MIANSYDSERLRGRGGMVALWLMGMMANRLRYAEIWLMGMILRGCGVSVTDGWTD